MAERDAEDGVALRTISRILGRADRLSSRRPAPAAERMANRPPMGLNGKT
jgi:hypothetical protein